MTEHDALTSLLQRAQPHVSARSYDVDAEIRVMAARTQQEARRRPHARRPLLAGLAAFLVVAGGATAAAAATMQWDPWALEPDASFAVTMPSGTQCEYRYGGLDGTASEEVRSFIANNDIVAMADVEGVIARARAQGQAMYDENGELQPAGPGSAMYDADWEYQFALSQAVTDLIGDHLRARGELAPYTLNMQADCGQE
ncbi:hypothetical protein [Microbacterium sp.]|uniref:hypothetical protein n=1 Tax=Microbacterium sp. TaxID=51671 RepID=UPI0028A86F06|nr:hypothetical protein [Microbacterium sp.]